MLNIHSTFYGIVPTAPPAVHLFCRLLTLFRDFSKWLYCTLKKKKNICYDFFFGHVIFSPLVSSQVTQIFFFYVCRRCKFTSSVVFLHPGWSHFTGHFNSLKRPQAAFTAETPPPNPRANVWQTASERDVQAGRSGTILMCHLISDHTVLVEGRGRGSASIGR